ncbi:MAG: hypothetical protein Q8N84_00550 [bacterium]|nr:hypothetical protein [bacterium]
MEENITKAKNLIDKATEVVVVPLPQRDAFLAALALAGWLHEKGKSVRVVASTLPIGFEAPAYGELVTNSFGPRHLLVSFDYSKAQIEKVDYRVENGIFNLTLGPVGSALQLSEVAVNFDRSPLDLLVTVGLADWSDLPEGLSAELSSLALTSHLALGIFTTSFGNGTLSVVDLEASSLGGLVFRLLSQLSEVPSEKVARILLAGLSETRPLQDQP